jgi:hypothetical protein
MNIHRNARLTPLGRARIAKQVLSGQTPGAAAQAARKVVALVAVLKLSYLDRIRCRARDRVRLPFEDGQYFPAIKANNDRRDRSGS